MGRSFKLKGNKLKNLIIIIVVLILICSFLYIYGRSNYIEITQFSPTTSRQMMGYGILTKNNKNIIIDGGTKEDSKQLLEYIKSHGSVVDCWIITHPHIDHMGAFEEIAKDTSIRIEKIYMSLNDEDWYINNEPTRADEIKEFFSIIKQNDIKDKIEEPNVGDLIQVDNFKGKVLGIKNPEITTNAINNSSMVIKFQINNKSILFLGDTGSESSEKLIKNQGKNLKADIVQVAHHGQNGATEDLYKVVKPTICLWPTPQWLWDNDSGSGEDTGPWKTKETRKWMDNLGVDINIVAKDGNRTIRVW